MPMKRPEKRVGSPSRNAVVMFLVKCLVYWAAALLLLSRVPAVEEAGINLTLGTLQLTMGAFGQKVQRIGSSLFAGGTSIEIVSECSPHTPFLIFAAVVLAFPASRWQRLFGLICGAVVIHLFNTIRIITLIRILAWRSSWFEFVHVYLWQTGTILILVATFALWLAALGRPSKSAKAA